MDAFIHPMSDVQSSNVGVDTKIWQFCVVLPGAKIGSNCNINAHVFIENDVIIGDNVTVKSGVQLWDGTTIENDVFIGPNVSFTNDKYPKSKRRPDRFTGVYVELGASIGANATLLPGVCIGRHSLVGAGSVITKDVPPNCVVMGNPGSIKGSTLLHDTRVK